MAISLRATVIGSFALLAFTLCLQGLLAVSITVRSAQQVTDLEQRGLVPTVGISILNQNIDQERTLLLSDVGPLKAGEAEAIDIELSSLDASIAAAAPRILLPSSLAQWRAAWSAYLVTRDRWLVLARGTTASAKLLADVRQQRMDRLNGVLDVVQSNAGIQLYRGERLYARAMSTDQDALRVALISVIAVLALSALFALIITRRLAGGLRNLSMTARAITKGSLDVRADERGGDEIAMLAVAFNHMTDALLSAERRADSDALTGLPNHRAIVGALDKEIERARRYERPCSVLFLDLDHFKALNDNCGHPTGDAALRELSGIVTATLRGSDIFGRWGGEEFVAILPETAADDALAIAERVRIAIAAHIFAAGGGAHLTCSLGMATYPHDALERDGLVDAADRAMYAAKRLGRNQTRGAADAAVAAMMAEAQQGYSREETALSGTVEALAGLVEARDFYTGEHTNHVAALAYQLALAMGLDAAEARMAQLAGRLHDIGKVAVPDAVLSKADPLTEEEWTLMRRHPIVGADVIGRAPALRVLGPIIRAHHERWDGCGYPDRLSGHAIPLGARVVSVADAYGAMTSDRPYRRACSSVWALAEMRRCAGAQFDPTVVEALELVLRQTPSLPAAQKAS